MCISISISPAAPLVITTFSVSGVLQTAIMFPSSSFTHISRIVQPPTLDGITARTSMMFGESGLTVTLFTAPLHRSFLSAVMSAVG